jgi:transcriptional regulator with XRE-family HTH domain
MGEMPNERLRALLLERGETPDKLAEAVRVDPKTVERWVTKGRTPYRAHRYAVAAFFGVDESYIWPDALDRDQVAAVSESEIVAVYPHRSEVPRDVWERVFSSAEREIGVLVYAGLFLSEDARVQRILRDKARTGVQVRILLGDPDSRVVADRGEDEGVGDAMAAKIRNALALYRPLRAVQGAQFRFHRTVLYNSIYLADDQLLVNTHIYGVAAAQAPVWHLHKLAGGELTSLYIDSFERVWESATPAEGS